MFERLLVAVDGTEASWRAAEVAHRLATSSGASVELVHVVSRPQETVPAERRLNAELAASPLGKTHPPVAIDVAEPTVPATLARRASAVPGTVMVMATHARGRSGALFGSVVTDVLDTTYGPVVMVGPHVDVRGFDAGRELVIPADGSALSETALGLGGAVAVALDLRPWVVSVSEPDDGTSDRSTGDVMDSGYARRLARGLGARIGREVEFEALHETHVGAEVARFAREVGAALVVATTHGRIGIDRLAHGSVAADIVRHAACPVLLIRPPEVGRPAGDDREISLADR
jgi:nucleotide-binding universal stress UspA family protein